MPTNAEDVLLEVDILLAEADAALADGNLGLYQEKVDEARALLDDVIELFGLGDPIVEEPLDEATSTNGTTDDSSDD